MNSQPSVEDSYTTGPGVSCHFSTLRYDAPSRCHGTGSCGRRQRLAPGQHAMEHRESRARQRASVDTVTCIMIISYSAACCLC